MNDISWICTRGTILLALTAFVAPASLSMAGSKAKSNAKAKTNPNAKAKINPNAKYSAKAKAKKKGASSKTLTPKLRATLLQKNLVLSADATFRGQISNALFFHETLTFGKRPSSVHPKAVPWLNNILKKWRAQRTGRITYKTDAVSTLASVCDGTVAAFVSESRDIYFCPSNLESPITMMGSLVHELGHVTFGSWVARPHVECTRGAEPGAIRCDPTIYPNPLDPRNGAFANTVYYYHTLYMMGANLSAYQKRQAVHTGEYFLNNYVNAVSRNPAYAKKSGIWRFR